MATPGKYTSEPKNRDHINDELSNGPIEKRSCRDVICCLGFLAFMGGMIAVAAYAISAGHPTLIGRGYDADGKTVFFYFSDFIRKYVWRNQRL